MEAFNKCVVARCKAWLEKDVLVVFLLLSSLRLVRVRISHLP